MEPVVLPKKTRKDPRPRHPDGSATMTDGTPGWIQLVNARQDMEYRLVFKGGGDSNMVPYYESLGYDVVVATDGGVRLKAARRQVPTGQPIEFRDHVLMALPKERADDIYENGPDGVTGQRYADKIEMILRREQAKDRIVGRGGKIFQRREEAHFDDLVESE